jgi:hypothetical protein
MVTIELEHEFLKSQLAYQLCDTDQIDEAVKLTLELEANADNYSDEYERSLCRLYAAPCLIDIGFAATNEEMVRRGIQHFLEWRENYPEDVDETRLLYNIANGFFSCWKLHAHQHLIAGLDANDHKEALKYYRLALARLQPEHIADGFACEVWTNYGNALDMVGRCVEAIEAYDVALKINPNMSIALGNKAVALLYAARLMHGSTHRFYLEALRLFNKALEKPLPPDVKAGFLEKKQGLNEFMEAHGEMLPEDIESLTPSNEFHEFLCAYCSQHRLFLNFVTLLGDDDKHFYGDPLFIHHMHFSLSERFRANRYVTFLNEIKQDYVLGRYFLVQSQRQSADLDVVDEGIALVYPLDFSLHSVYVQLLKAAMKQAIAVLDKVAFFVYDYCGLTTPPADRITFRQLFGGNPTMRKELAAVQNPYMFALFNLSREVSKNGAWGGIYEYRDALTHRFLVLHNVEPKSLPNNDIPREKEDTFTNRVIRATKIARAAVIYLILFVALEEERLSDKHSGIMPKIYGTPLDKGFRHKPPFSPNNSETRL